MKSISAFAMCLICIQLYAYNRSIEYDSKGNSNEIINTDSMKLKITVGTNIFLATLYNNATANAFKAMLPMTVSMAELNGNEKYFNLSNNLPANASNPGTVHTGDLMLYGSDTLVLFYKSFSTTYTYTKLGHIENTSGLVSVLGSDSITIEFELEN